MTLWLVIRVRFCYFLQELEVCNKEDGGDNVGAMCQGEGEVERFPTIEEEILLPPGMELKQIFGIRVTTQRCWGCVAVFRIL